MLTRHMPGERLARHRHAEGYAALVLQGSYIEAGDRGRFAAEAGLVVLHSPYESHQDSFSHKGAQVLNLPVSCASHSLARVEDPDAIARLAERDMPAACELLACSLLEECRGLDDWVDDLSQSIVEDPNLSLAEWAEQWRIAPQSLSRAFSRAYGVSPKRFRADQRALRAIREMPHWKGTGAALAAEIGYADQAHMTRSIVELTGLAPSRLR